MGTRATYLFKNHYENKQTFYIHWDGYPEGAAQYFIEALRCENKRGGLGNMFLRGNPCAEITVSHDRHADTEFQYDYDASTDILIVRCRRFFDNKEAWEQIYEGTLAKFIWIHTRTSIAKDMGAKPINCGYILKKYHLKPQFVFIDEITTLMTETAKEIGDRFIELASVENKKYLLEGDGKTYFEVNFLLDKLEYYKYLKTSIQQIEKGLLLEIEKPGEVKFVIG